MRVFISVLFMLFVIFDAPLVFADRLMLVGNGSVEISQKDDSLQFQSSYIIENKGDVSAFQVVPEFVLGMWTWAGDPKLLEKEGSFTWTVHEQIDPALLKCVVGDSCAGLVLPEQGVFPLLIMRRYQDVRGYPFSAPSVMEVSVGNLEEQVLSTLYEIPFQAMLTFQGDGAQFSGALNIKNLTDKDLRLALSFHASEELQIVSDPTVLEVKANGKSEGIVRVRNISGLPESIYSVFVVFQWEESGYRNSYSFSQHVSLRSTEQRKLSTLFLVSALGITAVLVFVILVQIKKKQVSS